MEEEGRVTREGSSGLQNGDNSLFRDFVSPGLDHPNHWGIANIWTPEIRETYKSVQQKTANLLSNETTALTALLTYDGLPSILILLSGATDITNRISESLRHADLHNEEGQLSIPIHIQEGDIEFCVEGEGVVDPFTNGYQTRCWFQDRVEPGASISAIARPKYSGTAGAIMMDSATGVPYMLTAGHNVAKWDPEKDAIPPGQDPNELLPAGSTFRQPSKNDFSSRIHYLQARIKLGEADIKEKEELPQYHLVNAEDARFPGNEKSRRLRGTVRALRKLTYDSERKLGDCIKNMDQGLVDFAAFSGLGKLETYTDQEHLDTMALDYALLDIRSRLGRNVVPQGADESLPFGKHIYASEVKPGESVYKFGRTSESTKGEFAGRAVSILGSKRHQGKLIASWAIKSLPRPERNFSENGDSGAVVYVKRGPSLSPFGVISGRAGSLNVPEWERAELCLVTCLGGIIESLKKSFGVDIKVFEQ